MNNVQLMEMVRAYQVGEMSRRLFLQRAALALGSLAAANLLLNACNDRPNPDPPPVVDEAAEYAAGGLRSVDGLTSGVVRVGEADGETLTGYLAFMGGGSPRPAVVVLQEWWGLNEHIMDVTRRIAAAGYVALAPDLYHGVVTTEPDEARKQAMTLRMKDAVAEIQQGINYLKGRAEVNGRFAITGFCMGGGLALQTAARSADITTAVPFYGTPLTIDEAQQMTAPVLSFLGSEDHIPAAGYETMHTALSSAGVPNSFQLYAGAQHAFFNDTRDSYHPEAAADAWQRMLAWFATYLGDGSRDE